MLRRLLAWLTRVAATIGFAFILVTATPVLRWWIGALSSHWGPDSGDVLVILGGEAYAPDTLGLGSYWRSFYGALTWRTGHFKRVVVSGSEVAPLMADFLTGHGVPRDVITIENESLSTRENAALVKKAIGQNHGPIVVLTSDYHSGRALREFRRAGLNATALPYPEARKQFLKWSQRWSVFLTLADETVKTFWYGFVYR